MGWRIENVEQLRSTITKGQYLGSPTFSACGLDGFSFHIYLRGDDFCEEGYCSLYFHVPSDTTVMRTLFLGRARPSRSRLAQKLRGLGVVRPVERDRQGDREC